MNLHEFSSAPGSNSKTYRKGRGHGPSNGKTVSRGQKGQWVCSGGDVCVGSEGGQIPLTRHTPRCGFHNIFTKPLEAINVFTLEKLRDSATISVCGLLRGGILSKCEYDHKVLGDGTLAGKLTVHVSVFSASVKEKTVVAGGKYEVV